MKKVLTLIGMVMLTAASITWLPARGSAGYVASPSANCSWNADGTSGVCSGSFRGFRNSANTNARANFYINHSGQTSFYAQFNNVSYSCSFSTNQYAATFASTAGQSLDQFFVVMFNNAGACTYGYLYQGSSYTGT